MSSGWSPLALQPTSPAFLSGVDCRHSHLLVPNSADLAMTSKLSTKLLSPSHAHLLPSSLSTCAHQNSPAPPEDSFHADDSNSTSPPSSPSSPTTPLSSEQSPS